MPPGQMPGARAPMPGMPPGAPRPAQPQAMPPAGARPPMAGMPPAARPAAPPPAAVRPAPAPVAPAPVPVSPAARKDPFGFGAPAPAAPRPAAPVEEVPLGAGEEDWSDLDVSADAPAGASPASAPSSPPLAEEDLGLDLDAEAAPEVAPAPPRAAIALPDEPAEEAELAPMHAFVPPAETTGHRPAPAAAADGGEAALRAALAGASREVIERIVWEVVPPLAETIIRENLDRLVKARQG
jgi:hypothetical protein